MKLSVAMKVILGFSLITALLLFSGVSSLISLKTVQSSQQQLIETAEPILDNTEMLRLELALSRESLLEAYYQAKLSDLSERRQDFSRSQQQLSQTLQDLQNKIRKAPQFSATLNQVTPLIAHYQKTASQLLDFQESHLNAKQGAIKSLKTLSEAVDDASSLLLDLADIAESSELVAEQQLVDLANETEGRAMSLLTASQDLMTMTELEQLEVASNTLNFLAQAIRKNIQTLSQQLTTFSEPDYLKEANAGLSHLLSLIKGPQSTLELHRKTLQQKIQATQLQQQISVDSDALTQQLAELNQQVFKFSQAAQQQVEDEVSRGSLVNWVVMSLSVIITILIAFFVVRSIVKPLQEVNDILHVVASGDLGQRLTYNKQDEFGTLANNVNILIDNLRQLIQSIVERSTQLGTAAEQTSAVTVQSTQSIEQQKQRIEQVATATTEMNSTAQQVVESANDTLTAIKHADDEAEHVKELAASTRNTMVSLAEEVKNASGVIDQLHEDSTSIGSILDVIRGVAEQTNLLALNAAIEAARAGEQGRGFAVVADEVRSLASRTQESTQEINTMIEKLQEGALQAVTVMSQGQQMAESCVKQVEDSTNALGVITDSVHHAHDISTQINQAALEQTQVTGQISEQLEQIVLIAEETTQGASQTADASQQVAGLSEELRSSIERFKV